VGSLFLDSFDAFFASSRLCAGLKSDFQHPAGGIKWIVLVVSISHLLSMRCVGMTTANIDSVFVTGDSASVLDLEDVLEQSLGLEFDPELLARCLWLHDHPLDINAATQEELLGIPGVTASDVEAVERHRRSHRPFREVIEVANVEGLGARAWALMRPFVTVTARRPVLDHRSKASWVLHSPSAADTAWLGGPSAIYERAIISPARGWECGVVAESDAGERIRDGFVTGYVHHESSGFLRRFLLGDFVASGGLGLVWGEGLRTNAKFSGLMGGTLSPHRSSSELGFLRGVGISMALPCGKGEVRAHALTSRNACSATVDGSGGISSVGGVVSFRTANDLAKRNTVHVSCIGGRIEYLGASGLRCGSSVLWAQLDRPIIADNPFELSGREFWAAGFDIGGQIGLMRGALELASARGETGVIGGLRIGVSRRCSMHLSFCHCAPGFHSLLATGGSNGDVARNTREIRWNVEVVPAPGSFLQIEIRQFKNPWRTGTELFPKSGQEVSGEAGLHLTPGIDFFMKAVEQITEQEMKRIAAGREIVSKAPAGIRRFRCTALFTRGERWLFRSRVEWVRVMDPSVGTDQYGWMGSAELRWSPGRWLTLSGRAILFQTEAYDARVYAIESDVDGGASSTILSGTGRRWYCVAASHPLRSLRLAVRYASSAHLLGSRISNADSQVSVQFDFQTDLP
jgi:hypothetical protein